jgi:serine protease Do
MELRDAYDVKLFEKEFDIKGNVMPLSFLDDRFFMNYWQSVVEGSAGTQIWNDIIEEAYLQFFYTPELAMILEEWIAKCNEPVSDAELAISKATLTKASPSDNATAIVTIKTKEGHGSGCIISKDGYVITNYHVVGDARDSLKVVMNSGEEYIATVLRKDPGMDLALLKIEGSNFCSVTPAKSPGCRLGDIIYVIGTPADPSLGQTITKGIFSAQRNVFGKTMYQTDAHVNPGNSGGGMFNDKGELVGIVSSKGSGNVIEGLGFAIPTNYIFERLKIKYQ